MQKTTSSDFSQTVIYTVRVQSANQGAWYRDHKNKQFECTLDVLHNQFTGDEIAFKVMGAYRPVKFIKQQHCVITSQRIATNMELLTHYGAKIN